MFLGKLIEELILPVGSLIEPKPTRTLLHKTMNCNLCLLSVTKGFCILVQRIMLIKIPMEPNI